MNLLEEKLRIIKSQGRKGLSVFITAGYPSFESCLDIILMLEELGVDFFEIGFPFSDPIADGPVIQKSSEIALKNGMSWQKLLSLGKSLRKTSQAPLVLMSYANPLFTKSWEGAAKDISNAGFNGIIVPDLILEESSTPRAAMEKVGIDLIHLVAPTSNRERIQRIAQDSKGFIYCVSITGVTGARSLTPSGDIKKFLNHVNKVSKIPSYLGFGISEPTHIKMFRPLVDGFIIGSKFIQFLSKEGAKKLSYQSIKDFILPFMEELKTHEKND